MNKENQELSERLYEIANRVQNSLNRVKSLNVVVINGEIIKCDIDEFEVLE